jgi:benzodiazapine receptor
MTESMVRGRQTHVPAWLALIGFVLLCQLAGALGALVTDPGLYRELERPSWAPPGWLFGPVWLFLYTTMGIAAWLIWRSEARIERRHALIAFSIQLVLNALWTPVFFGVPTIGGGLLVIALLDVAILVTTILFGRISQLAAWLLVPYASWVGFATALNAKLWLLN